MNISDSQLAPSTITVVLFFIGFNFILSAFSQGIVQLLFYLFAKKVLKYIRCWLISWGISSLVFATILIFEKDHREVLKGGTFVIIIYGSSFLVSLLVGFFQLRKMKLEGK